MKRNIGITDRIFRFVFMDLLLGACLWGMEVPNWFAKLSFIISLYLIITIVIAYSPLYHIFSFSTLEKKSDSED